MSTMKIVKRIAAIEGEALNRLSNWDLYSTLEVPCDTDYEEEDFMLVDFLKDRLAEERARYTKRDFETTSMEVQWEVSVELGKFLSGTIDPTTAEGEGDGGVCRICLEDMMKGDAERGMAVCGHEFHRHCLIKWVKRESNCPMCRDTISTIFPV